MQKSEKDTRPIKPVAYAENCHTEKFGIPRQSGRADGIVTRIIFLPEYSSPEAVRELGGFSHVWLIFGFSESVRDSFSPTVRPPRLGGNRRVGVFASRSPFRPNSLGLSSVRLTDITSENGCTVLTVTGADLLNGTPVYDVKPYLPQSDSHPDALGGYSAEFVTHRLEVNDPLGLLCRLPEDLRTAAAECIADDPRPSYQDDPSREYTMRLGKYDVSFRVNGGTAEITGITDAG